jgi:hypothetical protein
MNPQAVFAGDDQTGPSQIGQVPRRLGLRDAQGIDEMADAKFAAAEQLQYPQPGTIRNGSEHCVGGCGGFGRHIRLANYIRLGE